MTLGATKTMASNTFGKYSFFELKKNFPKTFLFCRQRASCVGAHVQQGRMWSFQFVVDLFDMFGHKLLTSSAPQRRATTRTRRVDWIQPKALRECDRESATVSRNLRMCPPLSLSVCALCYSECASNSLTPLCCVVCVCVCLPPLFCSFEFPCFIVLHFYNLMIIFDFVCPSHRILRMPRPSSSSSSR